jgi:hypothetical protein
MKLQLLREQSRVNLSAGLKQKKTGIDGIYL